MGRAGRPAEARGRAQEEQGREDRFLRACRDVHRRAIRREAPHLIREEGLENAWARATRHHLALKAGLEAMGLKFLVKEQYQLPQMNAVFCPEGVNEEEVRKRLLTEFGLEIGAGLGPLKGKIWRFGLMGYSCRPDNVMLCLSALGSVLSDMGMPVHVGDAEAAAHGAYAQMHVKDAQRKKRAA